ncbi:hypothetical protein nbrc107696_16280 [Gordonia spumicola]|uniref:Alpha/beta-hydrolase family protein n=2 Tax=Gordonia spumicola TaxID=589161 RepID=A0A7I9V7J9_9ACTN|nr:hypothetical protein nbrc107696_16280 [Gordonia spumicola]
MSMTPSLLPRDWMFQGLIGGISAAIGHGVGVVVAAACRRWVAPRLSFWPPTDVVRTRIHLGLRVFCVVASVLMLIPAVAWQRRLADIMGTTPPTLIGYSRTLLLSAVIALGIIAIARGLRDESRWVAGLLMRRWRVPRRIALVAGAVVVAVVTYLFVAGVGVRGGYAALNWAFSVQNDTTRDGAVQPTEPEKSGSPMSKASWDSLGFEGRNFVSGGVGAAELSRLTGRPAKEPIRVYAGLESAGDTASRMRVVVDELERTGAFDRKTLVVIPTTGTGWVNPTAAQTIELVSGGDSALVAAQYSYLPSWLSFVADRPAAAAAGRALLDAVHERWATKPANHRPKLYIYGESLGTQAGEGAFDSLADIRSTVDGVLWVGPPNSNPLWRSLTERRDPGTPEAEPTYADGLVVRFANDTAGIERNHGQWLSPRILYIQHRSDPVVWWSTDLLFTRPDWLAEPPAGDRHPSMRWFPIVTFWQVSADLGNAAGVPDGHGHNYGTQVLDGWVAVTHPAGWTDADTERIRHALVELRGHDGPEK